MVAISKSMSTSHRTPFVGKSSAKTPTKAGMEQSSNPWSYWRNTLPCMTWYLYTSSIKQSAMSKVQLALTLVVGIVIGCLLPKKDFFCQDLAVYPADPVSAPALPDVETPSMDPVAPAAPTPVRQALSMDSLVAHVQHLKEPLEQIRREVDTWLFFFETVPFACSAGVLRFFLGSYCCIKSIFSVADSKVENVRTNKCKPWNKSSYPNILEIYNNQPAEVTPKCVKSKGIP